MALTTWAAYQGANPGKAQQLTQVLLCAKGIGATENYLIEVDSVTGALPVSAVLAQEPIMFTLNGADQTVIEDAAVPANNRPLPVKFLAPQSVVTEHNGTTPASIRIGDGTTLAGVTATNQLKVAGPVTTEHNGATPSSVRIGDGTTLVGVTAANELKVKTAAVTMANPPIRNAYASTPVTTAAYVELVASLTATAQKVQIFDSSGQTLIFAVGAAGAENPLFYITPGGLDISVSIAATSRIAIKALSGNATVGEIVLNITT